MKLELDSIRQVMSGFSEFIDEYVESFTRKEFNTLSALKREEDWIETISVDSDGYSSNDESKFIDVKRESPISFDGESIKIESDDEELKPDIADYNFRTDTNNLFKKEEEDEADTWGYNLL